MQITLGFEAQHAFFRSVGEQKNQFFPAEKKYQHAA
jgi:peptide subunit release factor 1 (eRF1)